MPPTTVDSTSANLLKRHSERAVTDAQPTHHRQHHRQLEGDPVPAAMASMKPTSSSIITRLDLESS